MRGPAGTPLPGQFHRELRAATRSDHVALDALILRLDLKSRADYGIFLRVHHAALQSLDADWRDEDHRDFSALSRCAGEDLKALKVPVTTLHTVPRTPLLASQRIGVAYVIRGSRLGAGVLRRRIAISEPSAYLDLELALTWPKFLEQLDPVVPDTARTSSYEVVRGARLAFDLFATFLTQALA